MSAEGVDTAESEVFDFMVLTQTCDLVRTCSERPFVEVCPLVEVDEAQHREIERSRRPNYAFVPALADRRLVGDLDRVMTIEKAVVAGWDRVAGWQTDAEARRLALALARKRARVAFPDDFVAFATPLMSRMSSKHDKQSDEGRALRALREIRVRAESSSGADAVKLAFWFIRDAGDTTFEGKRWDQFRDEWEKRIPKGGRFVDVQAVVQTLEDLTARERATRWTSTASARVMAEPTTTNDWCQALGITPPKLEAVAGHREANTFALLLVALLERGEPMTLADVAARRGAWKVDAGRGAASRWCAL